MINVDVVKNYLSGTPITSSSSDVGLLQGYDLFMVSHNDVAGLPRHFESNAVAYSDLSTQVLNDVSDHLGFGTMAFQDTADFALSGHHHEYYNRVSVESLIPERLPDGDDNIVISAAKFVVNSRLSTIVRAILPTYKPIVVETEIGTISYVAYPPMYVATHPIGLDFSKDIHVSAHTNFNGWLYCDGSTVTCKDYQFKAFKLLMKNSPKATSFKLPDLRNFMYVDGKAKEIDSVSANQIPLPAHQHTARFKYNAQFQCDASFRHSSKTYKTSQTKDKTFDVGTEIADDGTKQKYKIYGPGEQARADENEGNPPSQYCGVAHAYGSRTAFPNFEVDVNVKLDQSVLSELKAIQCGPEIDTIGRPFPSNDKFWPTYQYMYVMIYVGKE